MEKSISKCYKLVLLLVILIAIGGCTNKVDIPSSEYINASESTIDDNSTSNNVAVDKKVTLKLYSFDASKSLINSIEKYNMLNKNVFVELVVFNDHEKLYTTLNTELMGGGGPDIFELFTKHVIHKNKSPFIVDINRYIENDPDFDLASYNYQIIKAYEFNNQQYAMPIYARFIMMGINNDSLISVEEGFVEKETISYFDMLEYYAALPKKDDFYLEKDFDLPQIISKDDYVDYFTMTSSFNSEAFIDILNISKDAREASRQFNASGGYDANSSLLEASLKDRFMFFSIRPYFDYIYFMPREEPYLSYEYAASENIYSEFKPIGNAKGEVLLHSPGYAMNANSKNQDAAWDFLKFMISEDACEGMDFSYNFDFYVNKSVTEDSFKKALETYIFQYDSAYSNLPGIALSNASLTDEKKTAIQKAWEDAKMIMELPMKKKLDFAIENSNDILESFVNGHISAEQVAGELNNKVQIYINE